MLISGTITAFFPSSSFMTDVRALSDYGLMEDPYNSKYLQYNKENIDCTNLNLNGNGLDINTIPESLSGLAAAQGETDDSENGISAYGTEENRFGSYDSNKKDFLYKCINNNDNELIVLPTPTQTPPITPPPPPPPPTPCEVIVDTITGVINPGNFAHDDPVNERMYVTNGREGTVSVIDTDGDDTNGITPITIGGNPLDIAYDPVNERMYVTDLGNSVHLIDTNIASPTYNTVIGDPIRAGSEPIGIAYDDDLHRIYVANSSDVPGTVSVIDTETNTEIDINEDPTNGITRINVGADPRYLAYDPINKYMYVTNFASASVSVIDTTINTVIDTIPVGDFPLGIIYDPVNHRMYVANNNLLSTDNDFVSVINLCPRPELQQQSTNDIIATTANENNDHTMVKNMIQQQDITTKDVTINNNIVNKKRSNS